MNKFINKNGRWRRIAGLFFLEKLDFHGIYRNSPKERRASFWHPGWIDRANTWDEIKQDNLRYSKLDASGVSYSTLNHYFKQENRNRAQRRQTAKGSPLGERSESITGLTGAVFKSGEPHKLIYWNLLKFIHPLLSLTQSLPLLRPSGLPSVALPSACPAARLCPLWLIPLDSGFSKIML